MSLHRSRHRPIGLKGCFALSFVNHSATRVFDKKAWSNSDIDTDAAVEFKSIDTVQKLGSVLVCLAHVAWLSTRVLLQNARDKLLV